MPYSGSSVPKGGLHSLRGLIFDCDGVLINSRLANITFYNRLRARWSLPPLTPEEEDFAHMATYEQALRHIFRGLGEESVRHLLTGGAKKELDAYLDDYYSLLQAEEGLIPLLDRLRAESFGLGVCTNRLSPLEGFLARFKLEKYFSPVQTASNSQPKPSPDGLLQVLAAWGAKAGEVAYIGDSKVDEQAAAAAGVPFWAFKNPKLCAALHFDTFADLHRRLFPGETADPSAENKT
ncbi:MAG: HAD family hydrolase [Deltaproteobacteria bacterium]|jgi:HAD superfamily hydrolase (TIGR01549 family)|nr:HAD family hydrolase [Deltaproteobacteria bacterium]